MGSVKYHDSSRSPYRPCENYYHDNMSPNTDRPQSDGIGNTSGHSLDGSQFDILDWHPAYQSCQRYFLDHAQYEPASQAVCALINIRLPFQWLNNPLTSATTPAPNLPANTTTASGASHSFFFDTAPRGPASNLPASNQARGSHGQPTPSFVSPIPYIRRLVVTGFDRPAILHGLFGDDWARGIMPHVECERRNYLFAAKHGGWRSCKKQYDQGSGGGGVGSGADESVPFMKPLDGVSMEELTAAEKAWSRWLAMEDWMVGPRAPEDEQEYEQQHHHHHNNNNNHHNYNHHYHQDAHRADSGSYLRRDGSQDDI